MKQSTFSLFLGSALALTLSSCGNPNSTSAPTPNTGNIPQLATRPTPQSSSLRKLRFSGRVFDALTGEAVDQVQVWIQAVSEPPAATSSTSSPVAPASTPAPLNPPPPAAMTPAPTLPPAGTQQPGLPPSLPPLPPGISAPTPTQPPAGTQLPGTPPALPPLPSGLPLSFERGLLLGYGAQALTPPVATASSAPTQTLFRTSSNNQGKFWLNDLPEGQYTLTLQAPNYRTLTLTQISAGTPVEIPLTPLSSKNTTAMAGMVLSPAENPVAEAHVSLASFVGESGPLPTQTNALGEFLLEEIPYGRHVLSAFVMNDDFVIQQIGFSEEIPITDKSVKSRKAALPSAEPSASKMPSDPRSTPEKRKELEERVENMLKESPAPASSQAPEPTASSTPSPEPSASVAAPNQPPAKAVEEEEQVKTEKPFNLFSAVSELVTGQKSTETDPVKDGSVYPVIGLRSVLSDFRVSGKVTLPTGYAYRSLDVWMNLKSGKDERPREVFLFTLPARSTKPASAEPEAQASSKPTAKPTPGQKPAPAAAASSEPETAEFSLRLPTLEKGQSYHFQFTAASASRLLYQHSYEIGEKNQKPLEISFLSAPTGIEISGEEDNSIPTTPAFNWEAVAGAEYYRVQLEAGVPPENKVIWEAWTKTPGITYPLESSSGQLKEQEVYTVSVAALKGLKPVLKNSKVVYAHPGYQAIWSELSSLTRQPFEVVKSEP